MKVYHFYHLTIFLYNFCKFLHSRFPQVKTQLKSYNDNIVFSLIAGKFFDDYARR